MAKIRLKNEDKAVADKTYVKTATTPPVQQTKTTKEDWDSYKKGLKTNDMYIKDPSGKIINNPNYKKLNLSPEEKKKIANTKMEY